MDKKKRKVDSENRSFLPEWTDQYLFILPNKTGALPVCLICQQTVAIIKSSNVKRHFETKHKSFDTNYPINSSLRKSKIERLRSNYSVSTQILNRTMTLQEKCTEASLRVSWTLAKHMKPFTDADIVKECMIEAASVLFDNKQDVVDTIKRTPLSTNTNTRNTEVLAEESYKSLKEDLLATQWFALALDESCDITDKAQLIVFVRFFNSSKEKFVEELLTMLPIAGQTRGEDLYKCLMEYFEKTELNLKKMISLTTDGAPAMVGKNKGLVNRLITDPKCNENLLSYHCIIHQSVLCCKLSPGLENKMQNVVKITNFIRSKSSLKHREFKSLLEETEAHFDDLLLHNNVRWLSKGFVLQRFFAVIEDVKVFLSQCSEEVANEHLGFLLDIENNVAAVAFLTDIFRHLNFLNLKLQGNGLLVNELLSEIRIFEKKVALWCDDIRQERLHFPSLKSICDENDGIDIDPFTNFLHDLQSEFNGRFTDFDKIKNVVQVLNKCFTLKPNGKWTNEAASVFGSNKAALQMEIIDFQEDTALQDKFQQVPKDLSCEMFWVKYVSGDKYPEMKNLATELCTMFGSTYACESAFSKMNFIKNKFRSRLTDGHLNDLMRISCTASSPNFKNIVQNKKCHFSH